MKPARPGRPGLWGWPGEAGFGLCGLGLDGHLGEGVCYDLWVLLLATLQVCCANLLCKLVVFSAGLQIANQSHQGVAALANGVFEFS